MIGRETRLEAALTAEAELISDLVVIGGGAAGMTAGRKTVVERSPGASKSSHHPADAKTVQSGIQHLARG